MANMIDPRIRTIRFWLLSAAVCGACLVNPGWAVYFLATYSMAPLGLFMPVFGSCTVTCASCDSSLAACEYEVEFSGWTNNTCSTCSDFDGLYVVTHDPAVFDHCLWNVDITLANCGRDWTEVRFEMFNGSAPYEATASFFRPVTNHYGRKQSYASAPACSTFSGEVLPTVHNLDLGSYCLFTVTCTVTAVT